MLGCLITLYDFSTPGTNPVLCELGANQHRLDFKGLCIQKAFAEKADESNYGYESYGLWIYFRKS